jgi:hypothetical protein
MKLKQNYQIIIWKLLMKKIHNLKTTKFFESEYVLLLTFRLSRLIVN